MKKCPVCKKEFGKDKWYRQRTFCSNSCSTSFKRKNGIIPNRPKTGKDLICPVCENSFHVAQWRFEKYNPKYCSRSCLAKIHLAQFADKRFQTIGKPHAKYKQLKINGKQVREHRWIMEKHLGRKLERWEHVHHINGDSFDNRLENLVVLSNSEHQKVEHIERKKIISSSVS